MNKSFDNSKNDAKTVFRGKISGNTAEALSGAFESIPKGVKIRFSDAEHRKRFYIEPTYEKGSRADASGIVLSVRPNVLDDDKAAFDVLTIRLERQAGAGSDVIIPRLDVGRKTFEVERSVQGFEPAFDAAAGSPIIALGQFALAIRYDLQHSKEGNAGREEIAKILSGIEYLCMEAAEEKAVASSNMLRKEK